MLLTLHKINKQTSLCVTVSFYLSTLKLCNLDCFVMAVSITDAVFYKHTDNYCALGNYIFLLSII